MDIDNIIISGVRIYFPPDNTLPAPSSDMLTFAIIRDKMAMPDYVLLAHRNGRWELATPYLFKETAQAISMATKISQKMW